MLIFLVIKHISKYYERINGKLLDISDEVPFDLPETWAWCRCASIVNYRIGKHPGQLTICIENLAAKWLRKVVGKWARLTTNSIRSNCSSSRALPPKEI